MDKYRYQILGEIGKGSFGTVFKAKKVRANYAIKKVRCDAPENVELALQEFWTLSCLRAHSNIIRFEECYLQHDKNIRPLKHGDPTSPAYMHLVEMAIKGKRGWGHSQYYLWFVMEYCDCGDMNDYLLDREPIAYLNTIFMLQLADGIAFLHKSNVVHRDLKPENILVRKGKGRDPILKIADFGLSKVCNHPIKDDPDKIVDEDEENDINVDTCWLSSACGSDFFMAPEVFEGRYTAKADVFALGIIFWAVMDRITFIDAGTKKVLLGTYVRRDKEVLPVGEALLDDPNLDMTQLLVDTGVASCSDQRSKRSESRTCVSGNKKKLRDLIVQMVHPNPEFRPSSQELLGKLGSILQTGSRPSKMNLNVKKPVEVKPELKREVGISVEDNLPDQKQEEKVALEKNPPVEDQPKVETKNDEIMKKQKSKKTARQKSVAEVQDENIENGSQCGRRLRQRKNSCANNKSNPSALKQDESENSTSKKISDTVTKAKRKVLSAVKKSENNCKGRKKPPVKQKSIVQDVIENSKDENSDKSSSESEDLKSSKAENHIITRSELKSVITHTSDAMNNSLEQDAVHNVRRKSSDKEVQISNGTSSENELEANENKTRLKLRDYVSSPTKISSHDIPDIHGEQNSDGNDLSLSTENLEFDEGLGIDANSNDSITPSEVPEFDSGYKSKKKSRRVSHPTEVETTNFSDSSKVDNVIHASEDEKQQLTINDDLTVKSGEIIENTTDQPISSANDEDSYEILGMSPFRRRHIGLKAQICKSKHSEDDTKQSYDYAVPSVPESPTEKAMDLTTNSEPIFENPKPKIEVPRTPCVVVQSRVGFRHNPFHTAVKKRWKYVVLDDAPTEPMQQPKAAATQNKNPSCYPDMSTQNSNTIAKSNEITSNNSVIHAVPITNQESKMMPGPSNKETNITVKDLINQKILQQMEMPVRNSHQNSIDSNDAVDENRHHRRKGQGFIDESAIRSCKNILNSSGQSFFDQLPPGINAVMKKRDARLFSPYLLQSQPNEITDKPDMYRNKETHFEPKHGSLSLPISQNLLKSDPSLESTHALQYKKQRMPPSQREILIAKEIETKRKLLRKIKKEHEISGNSSQARQNISSQEYLTRSLFKDDMTRSTNGQQYKTSANSVDSPLKLSDDSVRAKSNIASIPKKRHVHSMHDNVQRYPTNTDNQGNSKVHLQSRSDASQQRLHHRDIVEERASYNANVIKPKSSTSTTPSMSQQNTFLQPTLSPQQVDHQFSGLQHLANFWMNKRSTAIETMLRQTSRSTDPSQLVQTSKHKTSKLQHPQQQYPDFLLSSHRAAQSRNSEFSPFKPKRDNSTSLTIPTIDLTKDDDELSTEQKSISRRRPAPFLPSDLPPARKSRKLDPGSTQSSASRTVWSGHMSNGDNLHRKHESLQNPNVNVINSLMARGQSGQYAIPSQMHQQSHTYHGFKTRDHFSQMSEFRNSVRHDMSPISSHQHRILTTPPSSHHNVSPKFRDSLSADRLLLSSTGSPSLHSPYQHTSSYQSYLEHQSSAILSHHLNISTSSEMYCNSSSPLQRNLPTMPILTYCGSPPATTSRRLSNQQQHMPHLIRMTPPEHTLRQSHSGMSSELYRREQAMLQFQQHQNAALMSPPKLQRAITSPTISPEQYSMNMPHSGIASNVSSSEQCGVLPGYPYQTRLQKPTLKMP